MVEVIDEKSWGSIASCRNCKRGLTETMYHSSKSNLHCCKICKEKHHSDKRHITPKLNDAKFKCPEESCSSSLSFREFFARTCCTDALQNSKDCGLSSEDQKHRIEFQDLKKMMNLLELSERKNNDAKINMDLKCGKFENALAVYVEKKEQREESQKILTAAFQDAVSFMNYTDGINEKFEELKNLMNKHQINIRQEKESEKKMESEKAIFEEAKREFARQEEKRDEIQSELSSSLTVVGKSLGQKEELEQNGRDKCNVCFEKYNTIDRHFCVLNCGHPTCQKCLSEMPEKHCPICREPFTEDSIIKLFFN